MKNPRPYYQETTIKETIMTDSNQRQLMRYRPVAVSGKNVDVANPMPNKVSIHGSLHLKEQ